MARAGLDWPRRARAESTSRRVIKPSGLEATSDLKSRPTSRACDFAAGVARARTGSFATAPGELTGEPAPGLSALGSGGNLSASGPAVAASPAGAFSQASSGRSVKIAIGDSALATSPSATSIARKYPPLYDSTSIVTLSVSTSTSGSPMLTLSPGFFSQRTILPSAAVWPRSGMMTLWIIDDHLVLSGRVLSKSVELAQLDSERFDLVRAQVKRQAVALRVELLNWLLKEVHLRGRQRAVRQLDPHSGRRLASGFVDSENHAAVLSHLQGRGHHVRRRELEQAPSLGKSARVPGHRPGDQRVVEFEPSPIDASLLPATQVRDKRIVERALFAQLQSQVGRHARLVPAKKGISGNHRGAHQGEDERAVGDVIARQTAIQKRYALAPSLQSIQFWAGYSCAVGRSTLPNGISSNR